MHTKMIVLATILVAGLMLSAAAELQNVEVGGSVRLRGNFIGSTFNTFVGPAPGPQVRWPAGVLGKRPIGGPFNPNVVSLFDWDRAGSDVAFVEQRTRLNIKADFTDEVSAFIEVDSYDIWGEDFRSQNYVTGLDGRQNSVDDVEIFQAYIEADQMYGQPLRLRVGRQELAFGSQFLVGPRDFAFFYTGLSFDAVRLTYSQDSYTIDAWASKLAETMGDFGENDIDFYGVYASCTALENVVFDAYWMLLRDDRTIAEDVAGGALVEWFQDLWGVDDYDDTMLHTVGLRAAGKFGAFDFDAEAAYQFGQVDHLGQTFKPGLYGDDGAEAGNLALKLDAGYAFDVAHHPHLFIGFRYFGGEDNRDITFWEWLNPFYKPEASVNFNRLFSNEIASGFMDLNNDFSNAWLVRGGVEGAITEKLLARFCVTYYQTLEEFDAPKTVSIFGNQVVIAPPFSWWTDANSKDLGIETYLFAEYKYSADLTFEVGWAHLFVGDGLKEGSFSRWNGYIFTGGTDDDGADYVYGGCKLFF